MRKPKYDHYRMTVDPDYDAYVMRAIRSTEARQEEFGRSVWAKIACVGVVCFFLSIPGAIIATWQGVPREHWVMDVIMACGVVPGSIAAMILIYAWSYIDEG